LRLSDSIGSVSNNSSEPAPDGKPKLILKNIYYIEQHKRVNKLSVKLIEPGKLLMYLSNGKNNDGSERYCHFMVNKENIDILKKWLDEYG
jgi:hypothetical protein